jgi:hypothetical protein
MESECCASGRCEVCNPRGADLYAYQSWGLAEPTPPTTGGEGESVEHDHPGLDCSESWSYCWPCPKCGVCKFIGHGPLCNECRATPPTTGEADTREAR